MLYNAALRGAPADVAAALDGNRYEKTLFCVISGVVRLSRVSAIPPGRRLFRGLGGMLLPEQFWRAGPDGFRGGVELRLMSTTADRAVAVRYAGSAGGARATVFEIAAGRIDIGAELSWLSQYPGEAEFLFPPLSCLEVQPVCRPRLAGFGPAPRPCRHGSASAAEGLGLTTAVGGVGTAGLHRRLTLTAAGGGGASD